MESIRDWLNGSRNYNVGVSLYAVYGNNDSLLECLQQGESKFRAEKLLQHLRAIYEAQKPTPVVIEKRIDAFPEKVTTTTERDELPKIVTKEADPYKDKWMPLYKEMQSLRARLCLYPTAEERGEAAFKILELERKCRYWWQRRQYFQENGVEMPEDNESPPPFADKNMLIERRNNFRTYVSRYRGKLKKHPDNPGWIEKLDYYTKELEAAQEAVDAWEGR